MNIDIDSCKYPRWTLLGKWSTSRGTGAELCKYPTVRGGGITHGLRPVVYRSVWLSCGDSPQLRPSYTPGHDSVTQQDERYYRKDPEPVGMESSDESSTSDRGPRSKVARLLEEYGLQGLGDELEQLWTAETDRRSLRELADYFNQQLLQQKLEQSNAQPLDGEVENIYRLLTADTVSGAERTRVQRQLERDGIDVDALESDFITYQAIRTYLKAYRGAEYAPADRDPLEREQQNLQQLRGRTVAVTEGKIEQLRDNDDITLGEFRTLVNIQVVCEECNTQLAVFDLLERGGCDCLND